MILFYYTSIKDKFFNWLIVVENIFSISNIPFSSGSFLGHLYNVLLTKEWGIKNNICPVLYTFHTASTATHIMDLFTYLSRLDIPAKDKALDATLMNLALFMKPYAGKLNNKNRARDSVRFYDEREWRYIPNINEEKEKIKQYLGPDEFKDKKFKDQQTEKLKSKKISFEPNDIKYIVVESEREILDMYHKINQIKSPKYSSDDVMKLQTRIISMEHIRDDF